MKLNVKAFTVTCSVFCAVAVFIFTWWLIAFDGATGELTMLGRIYRGYTVSPVGSLIGSAWALVDGAACGFIFSCLYNFLSDKLTCCKSCQQEQAN